MAVYDQPSQQASEFNKARDDLQRKISGVAFGFGVGPSDFMTALERFIDASIEWKMNRRY